MVKLFKIVLILLCVWTAVEVYSEGVNGAFGGLFAVDALLEEKGLSD
jgi:hypothetical protein